MLEKIIYENHKGERFGGGADGIYINQNEEQSVSRHFQEEWWKKPFL